MIRFERLGVRFEHDVLQNVTFDIAEGDLCVVVGATGSGKSTLLGTLNGLVPHFTGGTVTGDVIIAGRSIRACGPRELADVVGVVPQDPSRSFVTGTVEEELAYGVEQIGLPAAVMRKRVEETLDLLDLASLRARRLTELSGGQQQRVAIGAALTAHPQVLVLDEPTSALDPTAAEDVLASIARLVHDLGVTVVVAEHRLERVLHHADMVVEVADGEVRSGRPADIMSTAALAPPVVRLGRAVGLDPVPLTVRAARRAIGPIPAIPKSADESRDDAATRSPENSRRSVPAALVVRVRGLTVRHGSTVAVRAVDFDVATGETLAIMGRNGAGKSSLLWAIQGAGRRQGQVAVGGVDPATLSAGDARRLVTLVPQTPGDLLYRTTVASELALSDEQSGRPAGTTRRLANRLAAGIAEQTHPHDLSEGQRLALVLAIQLAAEPDVVLLDEPTRGLDYRSKDELAGILGDLAARGTAIVVATHDVEFAAEIADRVVILADGDVIASGGARQILCGSPAFAPQIAKVAAPASIHRLDDLVALVQNGPA